MQPPSSLRHRPAVGAVNVLYHASAPAPTPDDARRALEVVMAFFQQQPSGFVDAHEYMAIGKLMEKLRLHGGPGGPAGPVGTGAGSCGSSSSGIGLGLPGGLHQIPEHDELLPKCEPC
jgi:hypothetical protein